MPGGPGGVQTATGGAGGSGSNCQDNSLVPWQRLAVQLVQPQVVPRLQGQVQLEELDPATGGVATSGPGVQVELLMVAQALQVERQGQVGSANGGRRSDWKQW